MSIPRPRPSRHRYLRQLHDQRLHLQVNAARALLQKKRWHLGLFLGVALVLVAAAGGALALLLELVFRR